MKVGDRVLTTPCSGRTWEGRWGTVTEIEDDGTVGVVLDKHPDGPKFYNITLWFTTEEVMSCSGPW